MAPADEQQPAASTAPAANEEALLKSLKSLGMYNDMFSSAAANIDAKRSDPAGAAKTLTTLIPAMAKEGVPGFLLKTAVTAAEIVKDKGAGAHPATRYFAEECAKLNEDDFKNLAKPLRLLVQATQKAKLPAPQAPRAWVGDKRKPGL